MRKLASIQRIAEIKEHPNADALELAKVLEWQCCVKKGEFNTGDLCVYCEIDSVMPEREEFEFLRPRGFRIKTIRLRGELSQGICFPLDILPEPIVAITDDNSIGTDITETLGVKKYEVPISVSTGGNVIVV